MVYRFVGWLFVGILLSVSANGQDGETFFNTFQLYYHQPTIYNPGYHLFKTNKTFQFTVGNRSLTGVFAGVNRFYADVSFQKATESDSVERRAHHFGLWATNQREGEFFQKNKILARYAYKIHLSGRAALSIGVAGGVANWSIGSSAAGGGLSEVAPDFQLGIWYLRSNMRWGASVSQVPNLVTGYQYLYLPAFFTAQYHCTLVSFPNANLQAGLVYHYMPAVDLHGGQGQITGELSTYFAWTLFVQPARGLGGGIGLSNLNLNGHTFGLMASYLWSWRPYGLVSDQVLEFSIHYGLKKK